MGITAPLGVGTTLGKDPQDVSRAFRLRLLATRTLISEYLMIDPHFRRTTKVYEPR